MNKYNEVENEIICQLAEFPKKALRNKFTDGKWTKGIKEIVAEIGFRRGFRR